MVCTSRVHQGVHAAPSSTPINRRVVLETRLHLFHPIASPLTDVLDVHALEALAEHIPQEHANVLQRAGRGAAQQQATVGLQGREVGARPERRVQAPCCSTQIANGVQITSNRHCHMTVASCGFFPWACLQDGVAAGVGALGPALIHDVLARACRGGWAVGGWVGGWVVARQWVCTCMRSSGEATRCGCRAMLAPSSMQAADAHCTQTASVQTGATAMPALFRTLCHAYDAVVLALHDGLDKVAQLVEVEGDLGDQAHIHHAWGTQMQQGGPGVG